MPRKGQDSGYHLMRVRIRKGWFAKLQQAALDETSTTGQYTTVSDLVRSALMDWMGRHIHAPLAAFVPSGLAESPVDGLLSPDEELEAMADMDAAAEELAALERELADYEVELDQSVTPGGGDV